VEFKPYAFQSSLADAEIPARKFHVGRVTQFARDFSHGTYLSHKNEANEK
jgi:hypothetical protein